MSDLTMQTRNGAAKGAATLAIFLWAVVTLALAYGLYNTVVKVVDLFAS